MPGLTDVAIALYCQRAGCRLPPISVASLSTRVAVPLALMNAERLGFPDEWFDLVVLSLLLSVVEDGVGAFAEAVRVTRPGGYLLVFDKFAPGGRQVSWSRRLLNVLTTAIGTDITRRLQDLVDQQAVDIVLEDRSLLGGFYQATLFRRRGPADCVSTLECRRASS